MNPDQLAIKEYFDDYQVRICISNVEKHLTIKKSNNSSYILLKKPFTCFKEPEEISFLININLNFKERSKSIVEMKGLIGEELRRLYNDFKCTLNEKIFLKVLSTITVDDGESDSKKILIILFEIINPPILVEKEKTLPFSIIF